MDVNTDDADLTALYAEVDAAIDEAGVAPQAPEDAQESDAEEIEDVQESDQVIEPENDEPAAEPTAEDIAREKGWRPKEEFTGDPKDWIDAGEFNRRQPLYDRLSTQNKELKSVKKTLDAVVKYQKEQEAKIRQKVIAELEAKKRDAVKYADTEAFDAAEAELKAVNDAPVLDIKEEQPEEVAPTQVPPAAAISLVDEFAKAHPWFDDSSGKRDPDMQAVMLKRSELLVRQGKTLEEAIPLALAHVKTVFPSKFTNPNKNKPSAVMSGTREQRPKGKTIADLTPEQKDVWRFYKSQNIMSEKDFLKSLEE